MSAHLIYTIFKALINKKALPRRTKGASAFLLIVYYILMVVVIFALVEVGIVKSLADAKSHADAYDGQSVPESAHKDHVGHIPHPFKTKRKHDLPPQ
jgi:hypothetical protein